MIEDRYSSGVYPKRPIEIVRGRGCRVWDKNGNEYIDCVGGFGVVLVGHCNDFVIKSVSAQLKRLITCPEVFYNDVRAKLFKKIADITPKNLSRTFLSNSGTESVECALKIARKFTGKKEIIAMKKAFHGRTMGSLSATWKPKYRKSFEPLVPGFKHATFNDLESIEKLVTSDTAGIILEVVQGEGGVHIAEKNFIKGLRELCDNKDILLIIDEIQSGFGRTGKMFALEHYSIQPDILCIGKGMAGGLPIGATVARPEIFESLKKGEHASTFSGNPLVAAASLATIDFILRENLPRKAGMKGKYFLKFLKSMQSHLVRDTRGIGLMFGLELRFPAMKYVLAAMEKRVLIHISGINTMRMLPPLVIEREEIDRVVEVLNGVLKE
jgi:acetylornithine/LysW-gamma-L-lysine aminotransferase